MGLRAQASAGIRWTGTASLVTGAIALAQLLIVARLLPPRQLGLMAMVTLTVTFATIVSEFGIGNAVIQQQSLSAAALSSAYWLNLAFAGLLTAALYLAAPLLASGFSEPRLERPLAVMSTIFVISALGQQHGWLLERQLRFRRVATVEVLSTLAGAVTTVAIAADDRTVMALVWGALTMAAVKSLLLASLGWREWRPTLQIGRAEVGHYLRFGGSHSGQRIVNFFSSNVDFLLIGRLAGSGPLGHYALAYNLANLASLRVNAVLARVSFPILARLQGDPDKVRRAYLEYQSISAFVNFPLLAGLFALAPSLPAVLGPRWEASVDLLRVLCVVGFTRSVAGTIGPLLLGLGRVGLGFRWSLLVFALQCPAIAAGVVLGEAMGGAIAFAVVQCVIVALNYRFLVRELVGPGLGGYLRSMQAPLVASLAVLAAAAAAGLLGRPGPARAALQIAAGGLTYLVLSVRYNRFAVDQLRQVFRPETNA